MPTRCGGNAISLQSLLSKRTTRGKEIIELGRHQRGILEELEKAHIYIQWIHERLMMLESKQQ